MYLQIDGEALRRLRTERQLKVWQLALLAQVDEKAVWRASKGVGKSNSATVNKLAKALNVAPEKILKAGQI